MKCMFCGAELPQDSRFCGGCGHLVDTTVPANEATSRSGATGFSDAMQEERQRQAWVIPPVGPSGVNPNSPTIPSVQGTPSFGNMPTVANTPPPVSSPPQPFAQGTPPPAPSSYVQSGSAPNNGTLSSFTQYSALDNPYYQPSPYAPAPTPAPTPASPREHKKEQSPKARHTPGPVAKAVIIVVSAVVVLGVAGAGLAAYFLSRPQPVITISSAYHVGGTQAGSAGTVLRITGQKFSGSSAITFLLDGSPVPGNQPVQSDASGNVSANMTITSGWPQGSHTITARDASNYTTNSGVAVMIVQQGQANTPGPQGAPADDASFNMNINISATLQGNGQKFTRQESMLVTGHPDPSGGTACQDVDDGQAHVYNETTVNTSQGYRETSVYSCKGNYKTGQITYTETLTSDIIVFNSTGATCTLSAAQVDEQLTGSYTGNHTFTGTLTYPGITSYNCNLPGAYFFHYAAQGNWTGQVS